MCENVQILYCGDILVIFNIITTQIETYREVTSKIGGENLTVEMTHFLYCDYLANTKCLSNLLTEEMRRDVHSDASFFGLKFSTY